MRKLNLFDLGIDTNWNQPMDILIAELNDPKNKVTLFGKFVFSYTIDQAITNRLLAQDLLKKRPEIASINFRPVFIVGMFRTGTTLLYNRNTQKHYFR
jgi:hypothetical protein